MIRKLIRNVKLLVKHSRRPSPKKSDRQRFLEATNRTAIKRVNRELYYKR